ncbi:transporter substrate-binding domain-containing protein [Carboxylicivirga mesophila]|uniref:histidine kinase n=1 Tax=Carboxylicivirga mesophila TaxID=1166478 RepID=A0ABS5KDG5_9BACT|nr:transporter substrate-binding domain-containing protein [Carboxylicivirga mesophila]MBS2212543.1 transporter substrate-binding domain-containing protein [Carboxylicivirga mesophila]
MKEILTKLLVHIGLLTTILASSQLMAQESNRLSASETEWLTQHNGAIRLAPDPKFAPFEYFDDQGAYAGMGAEYIRLIEDKTGLQFSIVKMADWESIVEAAKQQEVDVFGVAAITEQRQQYMAFTTPYLTTRGVIITRVGVTREMSLDDLKGMKLTLVKDYVWDDFISLDYPDMQIDYVSDPLVGMRKVSFGVSDAMVLSMATASYYIEEEGFTNLKVAGETDYAVQFSIAVRKDWPELVSIINKGIEQISEQEREAISKRWLFHQYKAAYWSKELIYGILLVLAGVLGVLVIMFIFNKRLNAVVKEKTKALKEEQNQLLELNEKLVAARDKATESERLTKAFLTNISHEVRTPMNSIIGFAQLIEMDQVSKADTLHYASLMIKGGKQLLSILDSIIQLSKMESGVVKPVNEPFDVLNLLRETHELMLPLAKKAGLSFQLQLNTPSQHQRINSDRVLLQQVLNNLISNAIKYTPEGKVQLIGECSGQTLKIVVKDTGIGVDEADKEAIFKPFRQEKHRLYIESGAGLGLATVKKIVEVMNGRVWLEANQPKGTIFYVELPVVRVGEESH